MSDHDSTYATKLTSLLRYSERLPQVFVDGGACHGDFSAWLATEFPDAHIHAFEPNRALHDGLQRRFGDRLRVKVWDLALHERSGAIELHVHADAGTSSVLPRPARDRRYFHSSDRVVATKLVPTTSLDEFIPEHAPEGIGLLKLDTQGAELPILRGAKRALQDAAIDVVYTEFFVVPHYEGAALLNDLWNVFAEVGYSLFDLFKGPYARNGQLRFGDAIFVSPSFRARCIDTFPEEV